MIAQLTARLRGWLGTLLRAPSLRRRYRVTPRQNPFAFRRELMRDIRRELRKAGWPSRRVSRGTSS